jgi:multidrug efflux pump subunit AcrA (membrane-fusion protein)
MVVKARVAAGDISKVRVCKETNVSDCQEGKVQLRFSAYPYPDYGTLKGATRAMPAARAKPYAPDAITPQTSSAGAVAPYNLSASTDAAAAMS